MGLTVDFRKARRRAADRPDGLVLPGALLSDRQVQLARECLSRDAECIFDGPQGQRGHVIVNGRRLHFEVQVDGRVRLTPSDEIEAPRHVQRGRALEAIERRRRRAEIARATQAHQRRGR